MTPQDLKLAEVYAKANGLEITEFSWDDEIIAFSDWAGRQETKTTDELRQWAKNNHVAAKEAA